MTAWNVYVGTFTKEFAEEIARLRAGSSDPWRGNGGGRAALQAGAGVWPQGGGLSDGIEQYHFDDESGSLEFVRTAAEGILCPQYLALHPTLPVLYAVEYSRAPRLMAFAMRPDGGLERLSVTDTSGVLATSVALHPGGRYAYVAHWGDGAVTAFPLASDGSVLTAEVIVPGDPRGVEARAFHHDVRVTPSGNAILVVDNGGDELVAYPADDDGRVTPEPMRRIAFPSGSGPRNVEIHPSGCRAYVAGEWDSMVYVLEAEDEVPTRIISSQSTLPPGYDGQNKPSELRLHPNGKVLYVGNRVSETIAIFAIGESGDVTPLGHEPCRGNGPASVAIDPSGRHVMVGNVYSGDLVVFEIGDDCTLSPVGAAVEARAPRSLAFVRSVVA